MDRSSPRTSEGNSVTGGMVNRLLSSAWRVAIVEFKLGEGAARRNRKVVGEDAEIPCAGEIASNT